MTRPSVRVRRAAQRDLVEIGRWYREQGGQALSDRFTIAVRRTFAVLAETPGLGGPAEARAPELADARRWRIEGFASYRIFYLPHPAGGISVLRVLHTSQNWKRR